MVPSVIRWTMLGGMLLALTTQVRPPPFDAMADDESNAVGRVRERLRLVKRKVVKSRQAILMVAGPKDHSWSQFTVPVWQEYCKHHGYEFFLQEEAMNTGVRMEWTMPRMLIEMMEHKASWRYILLVRSNTLPTGFNRSWEFVIKQHMRHRRYKNDKPGQRLVFCPWLCEEEYDSPLDQGACSGPQISGCVFWAAKRDTLRLLKHWYAYRHDEDYLPEQALVYTFDKVKERNYDVIFYKDVAEDMGRPKSKYIVQFDYDPSFYGWNFRDHVYDYIKNHTFLGSLSNKAYKEAERRAALEPRRVIFQAAKPEL